MANTREIQSRIKSINDTLKITNAMYMISSSKLKKARREYDNTHPYFVSLQDAIKKVLKLVPNVENKYFYNEDDEAGQPEKRKGVVVVTADKGLAGAYNHNVIKLAEEIIDNNSWKNDKLFVVGQVGRHFFEKRKTFVDGEFQYTAQDPSLNRARKIAEKMVSMFLNDELDEVYIVYTHMTSPIAYDAKVKRLLPLRKHAFTETSDHISFSGNTNNITLLPSAKAVFENVVPDFIAGYVYGALVESYCSEQNARMVAMQAASDSAKEMLKNLSVMYNRARQAAITQEITEVISGAKSLKNKE